MKGGGGINICICCMKRSYEGSVLLPFLLCTCLFAAEGKSFGKLMQGHYWWQVIDVTLKLASAQRKAVKFE